MIDRLKILIANLRNAPAAAVPEVPPADAPIRDVYALTTTLGRRYLAWAACPPEGGSIRFDAIGFVPTPDSHVNMTQVVEVRFVAALDRPAYDKLVGAPAARRGGSRK